MNLLRPFFRVFCLSLMAYLSSCSEGKVASLHGVDLQKEKVPQEIYEAIHDCINCGCHWSFDVNKGYVNIVRISKVYYSKDSTKALILATHQRDGVKNEKYEGVDFHIGFDPFIAYKDSGSWKLYHFGWKVVNHMASYRYVEEEIISYFEGPNFREKVFVYGLDGWNKFSSPIGVSPNEDEFWSSSLWQKDLEIEGLYPFELQRTNTETTRQQTIQELLEEYCH